jgi:anti-sigma regulatory factor (Ser/Thr protein kinase)
MQRPGEASLPPERPGCNGHFEQQLDEVGRARRLVVDFLRTERCGSDLVDAAALVVSELATNAVVHAASDFDLRCRLGEQLSLEIEDRDPRSFEPHFDRDLPEAGGGFGLRIVDGVADDWGVVGTDEGKTVWCHLDAGAGPQGRLAD